MTQSRIRSVLGLYLLVCAAIYLVGILFLREEDQSSMERVYLTEMLYRVGYTTALLDWLPGPEGLDEAELETVEALTPFSIELLTEQQSDIRSMTVRQVFPHTAYEYSEPLGRVVAVQETFSKQLRYGCPGEVFAVGISVTVLSVVLATLFAKAANLLAASAIARQRPRLMLAARLSIAVALLVPVGLAAALILATARTQGICAVRVWQDDVRRTVSLVGQMYTLMLTNFGVAITAEKLPATLAAINAALIGSKGYSMHVVDNIARTIEPPVDSDLVAARLLSADANVVLGAEYIPGCESVLAVHDISQERRTIAAVKYAGNSKLSLSSHVTRLAFVLLLVPLGCAAMAAAICFPYAALGRISGGEAYAGPWVWRSPRQWPTWKLLQGVLLVSFAVFAMTLNVENVSFLVTVSNRMTSDLQAVCQGGTHVAAFGGVLLSNYNLILRGLDWSSAYMDSIANVTVEARRETNLFYQSLVSLLDMTRYTGASAAEKAATRTQEQLPLLMNNPPVLTFLTSHHSKGNDVKYLEAYLVQFDAKTIFYILTSDADMIPVGDPELTKQIYAYAEKLDGERGKTLMRNVIEGTLQNAADYTAIAKGWDGQEWNLDDITTLYTSAAGRKVVSQEDDAFTEQQAKWPQRMNYDSVFAYVERTYVGWPIAAVVALGLCMGVDYLYTAWLYGHSRGTKDAAAVKVAHGVSAGDVGAGAGAQAAATLPPSNDYTEPRSLLNVNHFQLWRNARRGAFLAAGVSILCAGFVCANLMVSKGSVDGIIGMRSFEKKVARPTQDLAKAASLIQASTAAWMRAYLSRVEDDAITATQLTHEWATQTEISWPDAEPTTTDDRFNTELTLSTSNDSLTGTSNVNLRTDLREMSNIVFAYLHAKLNNNDLVTVYDDFIDLLAQFDRFLPMKKVFTCTAPNASAFLDFSQVIHNMTLSLLYMYGDDYLDGLINHVKQLVEDNSRCGFDTEEEEMYVRRCAIMRRRAAFFTPREQLATTLTAASTLAASAAITSIEASLGGLGMRSVDNATVEWLPIVMAWLCLPFVVLILRTAQAVHRSIYYS